MLYLVAISIFLLVFIFIYAILSNINKNKIIISNRAQQVLSINIDTEDDFINSSFSERAIKPFYNNILELFLRVTPKNKILALNKKLEKAGLLKNNSAERWMYIKIMITAIVAGFLGLLTFYFQRDFLETIFAVLLGVLSVNIIYRFYIALCITKRQRQILSDLPFTLDLITVSVEAGLSFDGALVRVISNIKGPLCEEFAKSLKETRMGIQKKIALKNLSDRCEVKEVSTLITSLIQADEMGVSLGKVLRIESSNLREHRKQVAREKAMKAPVKMLFPLIFFIFPSIFIIILGPAVIKMTVLFGG